MIEGTDIEELEDTKDKTINYNEFMIEGTDIEELEDTKDKTIDDSIEETFITCKENNSTNNKCNLFNETDQNQNQALNCGEA